MTRKFVILLLSLFLFSASVALLGGCGQKGGLYLPDRPHSEEQDNDDSES